MNIESKTARESWIIAHATLIESYKKSFDAVLNYILKEINSAAKRGEFSVKIKLSPLENFINHADFNNIIKDVIRVLTNGYIFSENDNALLSSSKYASEDVAGLGYIVEATPSELIISWDDPMRSSLDIALPFPGENQDGTDVK